MMRMFPWALTLFLLATKVQEFDVSSTGDDMAGRKATKITIPCVPVSSRNDEMFDLATEYHWTDYKGADLLDSRFSKTEAGDLDISNLHVADSGIYKCKVVAPVSSGSEATTSYTFQHKLLVYELTGHKFVTHVPIMMAEQSVEAVKKSLTDLLSNVVCQYGDLCQPSDVKVEKCESQNERTKSCKFALNYKAIANDKAQGCDEDCMRSAMIQKLEKARKVLEQQLTRLQSNPQIQFKPDVKFLSSNHLVTCEPGFHLIQSHQKHCYPCQPGQYSGPNSFKCHHCDVGYYQEEYGKHACNACPDGKMTDDIGSKLKDDCLEESKTIIDTLKKGIFSIFGG